MQDRFRLPSAECDPAPQLRDEMGGAPVFEVRHGAARDARAEIAVCVAARGSAIGRRQARDYPAAKALLRIGVSTQLATARNVTPLRQRMIEEMVSCLARKKMIYAVSLNVDRSINRAVVAGCAISATRNYLKLHI